MSVIEAARLLPGPGLPAQADRRVALRGDRIAEVGPGAGGSGLLVMPALANAHDHARVARASQMGGTDAPLEAWLPYLALIPPVDPWLASAVAFGRSARGGAGAVMAHYTRVQGLADFPTEAAAVAKAARDVGLRVALAVQCRDVNPLVYAGEAAFLARLSPAAAETARRRFMRPALPPVEQVALAEAAAADVEGDLVTVQFGPAGPQWCSEALLALIAERSAATGRRIHMHLLESRYQRDWADRTHPGGLLRRLDEIGLLSPRLSVAHGVWLRPDEIALLAERGVTLVTNASSNLGLASGLAPVPAMLRAGLSVAMGLDGMALDEDEDALRELRLDHALHKGRGFETGMDADAALRMATAAGRFAITGDAGGGVAAGAPADLLSLDWAALSAEMVEPDVAPLTLVLARARAAHVRALHVAGREIVRDGSPTGVDLPALEAALLAALRAGRGQTADLRAAMPELRSAFATHYGGVECC